MGPLSCSNCGMTKSAWSENDGEGYGQDDEIYCCRGCAETTGCTCDREGQESVPDLQTLLGLNRDFGEPSNRLSGHGGMSGDFYDTR